MKKDSKVVVVPGRVEAAAAMRVLRAVLQAQEVVVVARDLWEHPRPGYVVAAHMLDGQSWVVRFVRKSEPMTPTKISGVTVEWEPVTGPLAPVDVGSRADLLQLRTHVSTLLGKIEDVLDEFEAGGGVSQEEVAALKKAADEMVAEARKRSRFAGLEL